MILRFNKLKKKICCVYSCVLTININYTIRRKKLFFINRENFKCARKKEFYNVCPGHHILLPRVSDTIYET